MPCIMCVRCHPTFNRFNNSDWSLFLFNVSNNNNNIAWKNTEFSWWNFSTSLRRIDGYLSLFFCCYIEKRITKWPKTHWNLSNWFENVRSMQIVCKLCKFVAFQHRGIKWIGFCAFLSRSASLRVIVVVFLGFYLERIIECVFMRMSWTDISNEKIDDLIWCDSSCCFFIILFVVTFAWKCIVVVVDCSHEMCSTFSMAERDKWLPLFDGKWNVRNFNIVSNPNLNRNPFCAVGMYRR